MVNRVSRLGELALLYGSRAAGVLVSLVFIPLDASLLGASDFGWVALILSAQALMMTLDLGMSALIARDLATGLTPAAALARWRNAERLLLFQFAALLALSLGLAVITGWSAPAVAGCAVLFWTVTAQNVAQSAMLALGEVRQAALVQGLGVLVRAGLTAATLLWIDTSLRGFIISQLVGALCHLMLNRQLGQRRLSAARVAGTADVEPLARLARRGLPLFLVGAMGAAVMQVDKLLIGAFMGANAVSPYFLAGTYCLVPIAVLASPVAQFFQPPVIRAHAAGDADALRRRAHQLTVALLIAVIVPTLALWLFREPLIGIWLSDQALASEVAALAAIMLPAAAIGAVGYVPLALLGALGDFAFQARFSVLLTLLTLVGVAWAASRGGLFAICWIYLGYYVALTSTLWLRAASHSTTRLPARRGAMWMLGAVLLATTPVAIWVHSR